MSHFCMWAVTKTDDQEELENVMQPYHEYECTGIEDEYVILVDETNSLQESIDKYFYADKEEQDQTLEEWIEDWNGCSNFFTEDENIDISDDSYVVLSKDRTQLIKYFEYTNPNAKWDWWVIGGRWSNDQDMMKKSDFDYDAWFEKEKQHYTDLWNLYHPLFEKHKDTLVEWNSNAENINEMREAYYDQPLIKEIRANMDKYDLWDFNWRMKQSLEEYLDFELKTTSPCFGIVKEDGWYEKGKMGWWACVSNENPDWNSDFKKLWDSIPDDYYIWNVDCHI